MNITTHSGEDDDRHWASDVEEVIDRASTIENLLNQVIIDYCGPRKESWIFMWSVVLDTSVMTLGAKIKIVSAVADELQHKLKSGALHEVISLRNAFAHHSPRAHPLLLRGKGGARGTSHLELHILKTNGKIERLCRDQALKKFNAAYRVAYNSLIELLDLSKTSRT